MNRYRPLPAMRSGSLHVPSRRPDMGGRLVHGPGCMPVADIGDDGQR